MKRRWLWKQTFAFCLVIGSLCATASQGTIAEEEPRGIENIDVFLEQCPTTDPAYRMIREDFTIRKNGEVVGSLECLGTVPDLPIEAWTDELIVVQTLRVIYYMDRGHTGHLPWTELSLYDWLRLQIDGIDIRDGVIGGYCCPVIEDERYIVIGSATESNRSWDRVWNGISGNIGFYAHEARHLGGPGHFSCCGIAGGCDQRYDESRLGSYGVQWWLHWAWLTGTIDIGLGNLDAARQEQIALRHVSNCNDVFRERFCGEFPPEVSLADLLTEEP